jgi:uncharacterized membrane protein YidH (DUF202 family)
MSNFDETKQSSTHEKGQLDPDKIESEILANERTFLAWVRTNIAVMSWGSSSRASAFGWARSRCE